MNIRRRGSVYRRALMNTVRDEDCAQRRPFGRGANDGKRDSEVTISVRAQLSRRLWRALSAVLLLLCVEQASAAQPADGNTSGAPQEKRQPGWSAQQRDQGSQQPALRVRLVEEPDQTASRKAREEAADRKEQQDHIDQQASIRISQFQSLFSGAALIAAIIALFYTARAANSAAASAQHSATALEYSADAASAATRNAIAAEKALTIAQEQLVLEMRPIISGRAGAYPSTALITQGETGIPEWGSVCGIDLSITNSGRTPANFEVVYDALKTRNQEDVDTWTDPDWGKSIKGVLPPNSTESSDLIALSMEDYDHIYSGTGFFFVRISVRYAGLDTAIERETEKTWQLRLDAPFDVFNEGNSTGVSWRARRRSKMT